MSQVLRQILFQDCPVLIFCSEIMIVLIQPAFTDVSPGLEQDDLEDTGRIVICAEKKRYTHTSDHFELQIKAGQIESHLIQPYDGRLGLRDFLPLTNSRRAKHFVCQTDNTWYFLKMQLRFFKHQTCRKNTEGGGLYSNRHAVVFNLRHKFMNKSLSAYFWMFWNMINHLNY